MTRRRVRTDFDGAGMDVTVPSAESELLGYCTGDAVEIVLRIRTNVETGTMRRGDLEQWVRNAMREYYAHRNRTVGYSKVAEITMPTCVRIDEVVDGR